jgi:hypothetical protein
MKPVVDYRFLRACRPEGGEFLVAAGCPALTNPFKGRFRFVISVHLCVFGTLTLWSGIANATSRKAPCKPSIA